MAQDGILPFERGDTFKGGFTASSDVPAVAASIAGNEYEITDDAGDGHGTAQALVLVPVGNRSGSTLTLKRAGCRASTLNSHSAFEAVNASGGNVHTTGARAYQPDDRYTSGQTIAPGDIFLTVKKGPANARMSSRGGAIAVNDKLTYTTGLKLRKAGANTNHDIVAYAMQAATTENVQKLVNMCQP
jgi:hypothetical protein